MHFKSFELKIESSKPTTNLQPLPLSRYYEEHLTFFSVLPCSRAVVLKALGQKIKLYLKLTKTAALHIQLFESKLNFQCLDERNLIHVFALQNIA